MSDAHQLRSRKGFWDFCCEHTVAAVLVVVLVGWTIAAAAVSLGGHTSDFWKYHIDACR
jgi:hypothetical protein